MAYKKPANISKEEWDNTPSAVQALLLKSLSQIEQINYDVTAPEQAPPTLTPPPVGQADDDGATGYMPIDDDGGTVAMPPSPPTKEADDPDDGATGYMPIDDDGGTVAMPPPPPAKDTDDPDDGATGYMPIDPINDNNDDGGTVAMPPPPLTANDVDGEEEDGATAFMPADATVHDQKSDAATLINKKPNNPTVKIDRLPKDALWQQNIVLQERYRLRRILGKGGFGAAYLAEDIKLKRGCVVKQMLSPKQGSARELEINRANFEREASLLVQLNHPGHPNIPEIFDYFSDDSGSYLVMKYIEGRSLKTLTKPDKDDTAWKEAVRYTIDVCSALTYMHTHGEEAVLHRDIKPDNVLLGDDGRVWLVDFGLAQSKPVQSTDELLASDAQAAGSVGYTPFEQWLGESTTVSDVYAAGATLHHLVTGHSPLDSYRDSQGSIKVNIERLRDLHGQLDPIRKINRKLPRELEEIIKQATAPEPEQRLTALQFQQQLEVLLSGAKNAALFTFKSGESARTIPQLVDLCEQYRGEAQGYLFRGDFERWFTLINRNDLAEAASQAVKDSEKGKDGLERFLKLIMPNLFWRRLGKASLRVGRVAAQLLLVLTLAALIVIIVGTLATRWLAQQTIANYDWDYYTLSLEKPNVFSDDYLTDNARDLTAAYLTDIQIQPQADDTVAVSANLGNVALLDVPLGVTLDDDDRLQISLSEVNGLPLYWVGQNLSSGINQGIADALERAPVTITGLEVNNEAVLVTIDRSQTVAYAPPTPAANATPTATPTPLPTPTPPGKALLAVFNDLNQDVSIEIEGERWLVPANDNEVIEKAPGTYEYVVRYVANGQLAAEGSRTWDYRAYRWRIGLEGETFE